MEQDPQSDEDSLSNGSSSVQNDISDPGLALSGDSKSRQLESSLTAENTAKLSAKSESKLMNGFHWSMDVESPNMVNGLTEDSPCSNSALPMGSLSTESAPADTKNGCDNEIDALIDLFTDSASAIHALIDLLIKGKIKADVKLSHLIKEPSTEIIELIDLINESTNAARDLYQLLLNRSFNTAVSTPSDLKKGSVSTDGDSDNLPKGSLSEVGASVDLHEWLQSIESAPNDLYQWSPVDLPERSHSVTTVPADLLKIKEEGAMDVNECVSEKAKLQNQGCSDVNQNHKDVNMQILNEEIIKNQHSNSYKCVVCRSVSFQQKSDLRKHLVNKHGIVLRKRKKGDCQGAAQNIWTNSKGVGNRRKAQAKSKMEKVKDQILCPICGVLYPSKVSLLKHMKKTHTEHHNKQYIGSKDSAQCNLCGQLYSSRSSLVVHMENTHKDYHRSQTVRTEGKFLCGRCGLCYSSVSSLKTHVRNEHKGLRWNQGLASSASDNTGEGNQVEKSQDDTECGENNQAVSCNDGMEESGSVISVKPWATHDAPFNNNMTLSSLRQVDGCHVCNVCTATFDRKKELIDHQRKHGLPG